LLGDLSSQRSFMAVSALGGCGDRAVIAEASERRDKSMALSNEQSERLALHSAFAVHQIAKWVATQADVPKDVRDRLSAHMTALEGVLVNSGHDWIKDEIEQTERALQT